MMGKNCVRMKPKMPKFAFGVNCKEAYDEIMAEPDKTEVQKPQTEDNVDKCPYRQFMFDDLLNGPLGEYKCMAKEMVAVDEYGGSFDYQGCYESNYLKCKYYLEKKGGK